MAIKSKHIKETRRYVRRKKLAFEKIEIIETQAFRLLEKFGGARNLVRALARVGKHRNPSTIYRWVYPRINGGTGGIVPSDMWPSIILAARLEGILITPQDMDVREITKRDGHTVEMANEDGELLPYVSAREMRR